MEFDRGLTRTSRRIAGWLAILAMAFNALWPLVANARPSGAFDPATEICTVGGIKSFSGGSGAPQPAGRLHQPHCAFCTLGGDKFALPSVEGSCAVAPVRACEFRPVFSGVGPFWSLLYFPAHPRAPPRFS